MTQQIEKPRNKEIHLTTIAGPQAEAILKVINGDHVHHWSDKSVEGLPVVELWMDVIRGEHDYDKW